jgi:hypothetical protein
MAGAAAVDTLSRQTFDQRFGYSVVVLCDQDAHSPRMAPGGR